MEIHDLITVFQILITFLAAIAASSGFWLYLERKSGKKELRDRLLMGLAHDRIIYLGMKYIQRGWISQDEYENLCSFLFEPYSKMGGNGSALRLINEINKLPIIQKNIDEMKGLSDNDS